MAVADTGIGIDEKDWDLIFEEFRQVSDGSGRSHEGTGLGLALARRLVELHGGSIRVESAVGPAAPSPSACHCAPEALRQITKTPR